MASQKLSLDKLPPDGLPEDNAAVSDEIARVVSYLNSNRSDAQSRSLDLVQEITHRRDAKLSIGEPAAPQATVAPPARSEAPQSARGRPENAVLTNPVLAERYHTFCYDLDQMLESFRARVDRGKPVKH